MFLLGSMEEFPGVPLRWLFPPQKYHLYICQLGDSIYHRSHLFWWNQKQPLIGGGNDDKWLMLSFTLQRWVVQVLMLAPTLAHGNPIELTGSGDLKYVSISPWNQGRLKMSHFTGNKNFNWVAYSHPFYLLSVNFHQANFSFGLSITRCVTPTVNLNMIHVSRTLHFLKQQNRHGNPPPQRSVGCSWKSSTFSK